MRFDTPEFTPRRVFKSVVDLGRLAVREMLLAVDRAQDCFGDDTAEEAAIKSDIWSRLDQAEK